MALLALALTLGVWLAASRLPGVPPILTAALALALLVPALGIEPAAGASAASAMALNALATALLAPLLLPLLLR